MERITYQDFSKLDIRIGEVRSAEGVEGTDRLIKIEVDVGEPELRTLVAGMKEYYTPEEMLGKRIAVLVNLEPRMMRGIMSNGMLLAASTDGFESVRLLTTDGDIAVGSKVS